MMYHTTDIKKFLKCADLYYYEKNKEQVFKPYMRMDDNIIDLLSRYFHFEDVYVGERNDRTERFFENIDNYEYFIHARFEDNGMRINIPFMHKVENGFDLCFIYYGTSVREIDLITYRICVRMLKKFDINVDQIYIIYLNGDYVLNGTIDVDQLFICTNRHNGKEIIELTRNGDFIYEDIISAMNRHVPKEAKKCRYCKMFGLCEHYSTCFPNEEKLEPDSILTLVSSKNKNKMYEEGRRLLKDADPKQIEGTQIQYAQIMASRNNGLYVEKMALKKWLEQLDKKPISFIDFEWDRFLIPKYEKMKPMDVVCFEYALYYMDKHGKMHHNTFVGTGDCRRQFVETMIKKIPKKGPILAYNAQGAECLRLKELGDIYPEYKEQLNKIIDRFVDLATPFLEGLIYDIRMEGNYSLKKLVDICSDYSYKELPIYDGMEAVYNWREIEKSSPEEGRRIIRNLKEYCSLDAYGLFLVYRWLLDLLEKQ